MGIHLTTPFSCDSLWINTQYTFLLQLFLDSQKVAGGESFPVTRLKMWRNPQDTQLSSELKAGFSSTGAWQSYAG